MSEAAPESRVGSQFGPYRVIRLLGRGGMGEVYEACDTVKDRVVALKLMSQQYNSDGVFRRRMQREAHTAGRLQEPQIVPIHDFGEISRCGAPWRTAMAWPASMCSARCPIWFSTSMSAHRRPPTRPI